MICSSLNRDRFIVRHLPVDGLYSNLEELQGLRSVRSLRQYQRRPRSQCSLAPTTPANLETFFAIEPSELLVVHLCALTLEQYL